MIAEHGFGSQWDGKMPTVDCPTIGCRGKRDARAVVEYQGMRRVETACVKHIGFYVARAMARMQNLNGDEHYE